MKLKYIRGGGGEGGIAIVRIVKTYRIVVRSYKTCSKYRCGQRFRCSKFSGSSNVSSFLSLLFLPSFDDAKNCPSSTCGQQRPRIGETIRVIDRTYERTNIRTNDSLLLSTRELWDCFFYEKKRYFSSGLIFIPSTLKQFIVLPYLYSE